MVRMMTQRWMLAIGLIVGLGLHSSGARAESLGIFSIGFGLTGSGRKARVDLRVASASLTFMTSSGES